MIHADGGRVCDMGIKRNTDVSTVLRLRRLIREGRYDAVHAPLYRAQIPGTASGLSAALATQVAAGRRERKSGPAIEQNYGLEAVTARIDDLCEQQNASPARPGSSAASDARSRERPGRAGG
jgi:hypothetical protein